MRVLTRPFIALAAGTALAAFQFMFSETALGQDVEAAVVPPVQAQEMLKALIPHGKKFVTINAYVGSTDVKDVNLGLSCSSSSSGSTSGSVDDSGNINARTNASGSSNCRERHNYYHTMKLGLPDSTDPQSAYLITVQCVEKWAWNHCNMPPKDTAYPVVLEVGKHGTFNVYAATSEKLGAKGKVSKYAVLDVSHIKQKETDPKQSVAN